MTVASVGPGQGSGGMYVSLPTYSHVCTRRYERGSMGSVLVWPGSHVCAGSSLLPFPAIDSVRPVVGWVKQTMGWK